MILPDTNAGDGDQKPHKRETEAQVWTPRELIESLSKWAPDEPIMVMVRVNPLRAHDVVLVQDATNPNTIKIK